MKTIITISLFSITFIIAACSSSKKSAGSANTSSNTQTTMSASTTPLVLLDPMNGSPAPGNDALAAIQIQHKEVTMEQLKEGYTIYTQGACMNCHGAANIYNYDTDRWKNIIDDMAVRAEISASQKDALYKYVLSIKAKQPN